MANNYLIGIGGTGARVIESVVHMCSLGFGPDNLTIFLIDPDDGNGNLTRTKILLSKYIDCRKRYEKHGDSVLFKTEIRIPDPLVWNILQEHGSTLSAHIHFETMEKQNPDLAGLVSLLFTKKELATELNEGFRGHPSIGAVVMAEPPEDKYPFKILFDDMADKQPNSMRVFLVGSIFGGTGAAGVPTIGSERMIKFNQKASIGSDQSKVLLGGVLVLPYFSFTKKTTDETLFVTADDFPIATKAALQYYDTKQLGYDQMYLLGDSLSQNVGIFSVGNKTQENLPHYIEMFSGLAAFDFYAQPVIKDIPKKQYLISTRDNDNISWGCLPVSRDSEDIFKKQNIFKELLTTMTIFAYSISTYGKNTLGKPHESVFETWYKDNFKFKVKDAAKDPRHLSNKEMIDMVISFAEEFLFWICSMDYENVSLIDKLKIVKGELKPEQKPDIISPDENKFNVGLFLKGMNSKKNDFDYFINQCLTFELDSKAMNAGNRFINMFYLAAKSFYQKNYTIN